jgi:hypothetical protein
MDCRDWLKASQPGNTAVTMYDAYGSGISDTGIARGAVTPGVTFKMAAAFTARNAAMVLNGGTAGAAVPLHWPGLLFTRMLIGSYVSPGTNMLDGFIARIRGWAAYLATADLQMMTLPIPVAQIGARGAADGSGLALPLGVASVFGRGAGVARGQSAPPSVLALLAAQGFGASAMRGDITLPGNRALRTRTGARPWTSRRLADHQERPTDQRHRVMSDPLHSGVRERCSRG